MPLYKAKEFTFFRCLEWKDEFYGNTFSELFNGNLRLNSNSDSNRYSKIFLPGTKISYWANSYKTARAEIKKWGASSNIMTFEAYDDVSSFRPMFNIKDPLIIVDGRKCGLQSVIDKLDNYEDISKEETDLMHNVFLYKPDCLVYDSHAYKGGENFIFFERGFNKLALKRINLRLSKDNGGNHNGYEFAQGSDYLSSPEAYGLCFEKKTRLVMNYDYLNTEEYKTRKRNLGYKI